MWKGADAVVVPVGKANEDEPEFTKSIVIEERAFQNSATCGVTA